MFGRRKEQELFGAIAYASQWVKRLLETLMAVFVSCSEIIH
jgi:hypothetical protein